MERYDVNDVIANAVNLCLPDTAQKQSGPVSKHLGASELSEVSTQIVAFIESVPRPYRVLFPLPGIQITREIKLSDSISLIRTPKDGEEPAGVLSEKKWAPKPKSDTTYLSVVGHGYFADNLNQSAMRDALSLMKRVVQVGMVKDAFERDRSANPGQMLAEMLGAPSERIHQAVVYDTLASKKPPVLVKLRLGTSSYLETLRVFDDSKLRLALKRPLIRSSNREIDLEKLIAFPVALMTSSETEENTNSLRSALEWAFDSEADDEPSASFIKTCIALEAALAEESEGDQITERLADRCAFLLNKTAIERAKTRRLIKDVYKLRSKLVHGAKTKFTPEDRELNLWATVHLSVVLSNEIAAVETWWLDRKRS